MTMFKLFTILIVAAIIESVGVAFLAGGLKELSGFKTISIPEIGRILLEVVTNGKILFGVLLEAIFFGALCYMLSQKDVSLVWPLTSLGMIITPIAAKVFLNEEVSPMRWAGIVLIGLGACLISYSEHQKEEAQKVPHVAAAQEQQVHK